MEKRWLVVANPISGQGRAMHHRHEIEAVLRRHASKVKLFDADLQRLVDDMFETMYNAGLVKLCAVRNFPAHQYLWPIPTKEILINSNLTQNPGY